MKSDIVAKAPRRRGSSRSGDKKRIPNAACGVRDEALCAIACADPRSLADVVREALTLYLAPHSQPQAVPP